MTARSINVLPMGYFTGFSTPLLGYKTERKSSIKNAISEVTTCTQCARSCNFLKNKKDYEY